MYLLLLLVFASVQSPVHALRCHSDMYGGHRAPSPTPIECNPNAVVCCATVFFDDTQLTVLSCGAHQLGFDRFEGPSQVRNQVGCAVLEEHYYAGCCCSGSLCNGPHSLVQKQAANRHTCHQSSQTVSPICGLAYDTNRQLDQRVLDTGLSPDNPARCEQEEFGCVVQVEADDSANLKVHYSCVEKCVDQTCKESDGKTSCCCRSDNCNDEYLALQAFVKICRFHQCWRGPNYSPTSHQSISSLCGHHDLIAAGVSAPCKFDQLACAIEVKEEPQKGTISIDYLCAKTCDDPGCIESEDKIYCCCKGENCNNNLAKRPFQSKCHPQQCPQGTRTVQCNQELPEMAPSSCQQQEQLSCSVEVHVDIEGTKMSSSCGGNCTMNGCGWVGDVYRCCCVGHSCNTASMAQSALEAHCNRTRCIGAIQYDLCSYSNHFLSANERLLCDEREEGCGVGVQMAQGGVKLNYSCVTKCNEDACLWMGDKYVCCCSGHNCNQNNISLNAFKTFCGGPTTDSPTSGERQIRVQIVAVLTMAFIASVRREF